MARFNKRKEFSLTQKCLMTILVLVLCRIMCSIPTPGVNSDYFRLLLESNASLGFLNMMTGSGLSSLSVMALSITPYITASIVIQLLAVVFPQLHEMMKGMKDQQDKVERITIATGAAIAAIEGLSMSVGFGRQGMLISYKWYWVLAVTLIWTLFSTLLAIIGKVMTDKKNMFVGNGVSLILATNILSSYPSDIRTIWSVLIAGKKIPFMILIGIAVVAAIYAMFCFVCLTQECEKRIPVNYSGRMSNYGSNKNVSMIPIKLCPGGVVPVIFASSIMTFPILIAEAFQKGDLLVFQVLNSNRWFNASNPSYTAGAIIYIALIFFFSYFYADITFNPDEIAQNIRKAGGNVSGIRAGKSTSDYLRSQMKILLAIGAAALSVIAIIPVIVSGVFGIHNLAFFGTSILITISVILETAKDIKLQNVHNSYKKKAKKGGLLYYV